MSLVGRVCLAWVYIVISEVNSTRLTAREIAVIQFI